MFCKNCGAQLADSAKFCGSCGQAITSSPQAATNPKGQKKTVKKYLIIVALVAIVIFVFSSFGGRSAEDTALQFVEGMLSGNAKKCVSLLTDDAVEQTGYATRKVLINVMDDALDGLIEEYKDKYGNKWKYQVTVVDSYEYTYEYYSGDYIGDAVKVVLEIEHTGKGLFNNESGSETETLIVVKDGGEWLVSGFEF